MCIQYLDKRIKPRKDGVYYKVMIPYGTGYRTPYQYLYRDNKRGKKGNYFLGQMYKDKVNKYLLDSYRVVYRAGFHVFRTKYGAKQFINSLEWEFGRYNQGRRPKILVVKIGKIIAKGKQLGIPVLVSKEITLLRECKE